MHNKEINIFYECKDFILVQYIYFSAFTIDSI